MFDLIVYRQLQGPCPYERWFKSLRDERAQSRIFARLRQVQAGSIGDCKPVGEGVIELRIDVGAGYRLYRGRSGATLIVLLCGGDKSSQDRDIESAKAYWTDWKRRQP